MPRPRADVPTYSLTERGGWWYVQWWENGAARRVSCRTKNQGEARRFLAEFRVGQATPQAPKAPTIGQVLDGYAQNRDIKGRGETLKYDVAALKRHLGDLPVDLLDARQSRAYCVERRNEPPRIASAKHRKTPRPLSDGTLIRELGTLRAALAWAVQERWIITAPFVERPSAPPPRDRWLTPEEFERLLESAVARHVRLYIALAVYTGARMGAILELTWDRVDLDARLIDLGPGRGRKRRATVPIVDRLLAELKGAAEIATSAFVVEHGSDKIATVKTGIGAAAKRAKLQGVTPNVFRHTAATWMVQRNVPFPMIARWLGNSAAMIEKVYGHHSPEWLRRAGDALSRPLNEKTRFASPRKTQ